MTKNKCIQKNNTWIFTLDPYKKSIKISIIISLFFLMCFALFSIFPILLSLRGIVQFLFAWVVFLCTTAFVYIIYCLMFVGLILLAAELVKVSMDNENVFGCLTICFICICGIHSLLVNGLPGFLINIKSWAVFFSENHIQIANLYISNNGAIIAKNWGMYPSVKLLAFISIVFFPILALSSFICSLISLAIAKIYSNLRIVSLNISYSCLQCYQNMLPIYLCPECKRQHNHLSPSLKGIFYHTCKCRYKLPTLDFLGKTKIEQRCRCCHYIYGSDSSFGKMPQYHFLLFGDVAAGKTTLLLSFLSFMKKTFNKWQKIQWRLSETSQSKDFAVATQKLLHNKPLTISKSKKTTTWGIEFVQNKNIKNLVYIYDPAGDMFLSEDKIYKLNFNVDGFMFFIDALSIEGYNIHENLDQNLKKIRHVIIN